MVTTTKEIIQANKNADPLTGAHGAHPVGTGIGAAGAGALGAAVGTAAAGPVGGLAGAAIGAVVGGLLGKGIAEGIDPTVEVEYWREAYIARPYYDSAFGFGDYEPAYRYGWEARHRLKGRQWSEVEADLERDWPEAGAKSPLKWERAKDAVRDAWDRVTGSDEDDPPKGKNLR